MLLLLSLLLLCVAAADDVSPSTEPAALQPSGPPAALPELLGADYAGYAALSWMGPVEGCAEGGGGLRREVACALPSGKVELTFDRAEYSLELRCEDETFNCSELSAARELLADAPSTPGTPAPLAALTVKECRLPPGPLACLPPLAGARDARLLKIGPLRAPLTPEQLRGLEGVTRIRIYDASPNITSVPYAALALLPNLTSFTLVGGSLELRDPPGAGPPEVLTGLRNLELSQGALSALPARCLTRTPHLTSLLLWGNKIQEIDQDAFEGLGKLVNVSLNSNLLAWLPAGALRHAPRLRRLDLYDNRLLRLDAAALAGLPELREFVLFSNAAPLTLGPAAFSELPALAALRLDSSRLSLLPPDVFRGARALARLDLSRNTLEMLPEDVFRDAPLTSLELGRNRLRSLPARLLAGQTQLRELGLGGNQLDSLPDGVFGDLAALTRLDLKDNQLETLQTSLFSGARALLELDLGGNRLRSLRAETFDVLKNLQVLSVAHNGLAIPPAGAGAGGGVYAYAVGSGLDASAAPQSPFRGLPALRSLALAHNNLTAVCDDWRLHPFLRTLDLSYNHIQDVNLDFLGEATVDLRHNDITALFPAPRPEPPPATFLLGFNPYACDCALYPLLYRYPPSVFTPNMDLKGAVCATPAAMKGRDVTTVDPFSLTCSSSPCPDRCSCTIRPAASKYELKCSALPPSVPDVPNDSFHMDISLRSFTDVTALPAYVKYLNLSALNLTEVPDVSSAVEIDLTDNLIQFVPENAFRHNVTLKLSKNPLDCSCAERDHVVLLKRHRSQIADFGNITCFKGSIDSVSVEQLCAWRDAAVVGGSLAVLGVAIVVLAASYYRYRREVRILLKKYGIWVGTEDVSEAVYDAFVSYAHQDEAFVAGRLVPRLEGGRRRLRLCVHARDWRAGDWIPAQIARSVEQSRRTVVVLSRHFLASAWGLLEFRAAHGRDRVVILLLEDVCEKDLDAELRAYIAMNTYVRADDPMVWDKLKDAVLAKRKGGEKSTPKGLDVQLQNGVLVNNAIKPPMEELTPKGLEAQLQNRVLVNNAIKSPMEELTPKGLDVQLKDGMLVSTIKLPPV